MVCSAVGKVHFVVRCSMLPFTMVLMCLVAMNASGDSAPAESQDPQPKPVSLVALIADPPRHQEQSMRVVGVVSLAFEGTVLYLHQEDYDHRIPTNAIWLEIAISEANRLKGEMQGKYVVAEGTFDAQSHGLRQ